MVVLQDLVGNLFNYSKSLMRHVVPQAVCIILKVSHLVNILSLFPPTRAVEWVTNDTRWLLQSQHSPLSLSFALLTSPWPQPSISLFFHHHLHHLLLWLPSIFLWISDVSSLKYRSHTSLCYFLDYKTIPNHIKGNLSRIYNEVCITISQYKRFTDWSKGHPHVLFLSSN